MNRRHFLSAMAATAAASRLGAVQPTATPRGASLSVGYEAIGPTIPRDFTGLSYESAQLANPAFFSPQNSSLIELFRGLSPNGNLRLGGGSSEFTTYSAADPTGPTPFEVFGPDSGRTVRRGTTTTPLALRNLRGFLDATGWSCLYGLNLGQGTKENAAAEAAAAHSILGPRLLALQIGNEPDSFRRSRPATYGPDDSLKEWNAFHTAIVAATPAARFAGPDLSSRLAYLTAFAAEAHLHKDVVLLTGHYYALGSPRSPDATLDQLFDPDPKLATIHRRDLPAIDAAMETAGLPFRMCEVNSSRDGGKPGVSDTLASALWCAETMLRFAQIGCCGVNLHGGGNGFATPIAGAPSTGFTKRPEYFGIQLAQTFAGSSFQSALLTGAPPRVTAYALEFEKKQKRVAVFNKQETPLVLTLPSKPKEQAQVLTGPSFASKKGITFSSIRIPRSETVTVPARAAVIYEF